MIYQFKKGARISGVTPQVAGETLEGLRKKNDGMLQPEYVVEAAAALKSKIHKAFEWSNEKAAHEYRLYQARNLIRSLVVVMEDKDEPAFVHIEIDKKRYYQATEIACQNTDEWQIVRDQAVRYLQSASDKLDALDYVSRRVRNTAIPIIGRIKRSVDMAKDNLQSI